MNDRIYDPLLGRFLSADIVVQAPMNLQSTTRTTSGPFNGGAEQASWVLNRQTHDVPVLVMSRLPKPLGNAQSNSVKYFATAEAFELAKYRVWLAKVTNAVSQHWKQKNQHKTFRAELVVSGDMPI